MKHFWQTIKDKLTKIDYFFLGFIVFMALFFTFAIPPMQKPDEATHYYKSVNIASGNFFCNQKKIHLTNLWAYSLPEQLNYKRLLGRWEESFSKNDFKNVVNSFNKNMGEAKCIDLPFFGYVFSGLAVNLSSLFMSPTSSIFGFYFARFLNLCFFFSSVLIALYLIPKNYKLLLFSFLIFPMLLHQAGAISYDSFLNSLIVIVFSYLVNLAVRFKENDKIQKKEFFLMLFLLTITTLIKSGYYLLFFLIFLLPFWKLFKNKIVYFLSIIFCIVSIFLYSSYTTKGLTDNIKSGDGVEIYYNSNKSDYVSPRDQILFLKSNPLFLKTIIVDTAFNKSGEYFMNLIGVFGALDTPLPFFIDFLFSLIVSAILIYQIWITRKQTVLNWQQLWLVFVVVFGTMGLIIFSFYFTWTSVGNNIIEGVQGRYFLPLLPFIFLFIVDMIKRIGLKKFFYKLIIYSLVVILTCILYITYQRYWEIKEVFHNNEFKNYQASESATLKEK